MKDAGVARKVRVEAIGDRADGLESLAADVADDGALTGRGRAEV
ncbi:hypothetical protein [Streptomyces sp. C10]